ncbi:hypothetical protein [Kyrpidia tusciae]|uniref:Uncharacterized protein n=1 Tax=Kyrpidia tusciae (strain DSM 2912 / NBRC 15312 / T2) TaxID=562970 RepID=D5WR11_KYRT2|nr:hypothetical protein [Kyrpidia tusciae]ADG04801.1 hypothetical protein Btus_0021 [Kyrpidia tusciae DSM 2912]
MIAYQTNGRWLVRVEGGRRNRDTVPGETLEVPEKPRPVACWRDEHEDSCGHGTSWFTQFRAGDVTFCIESFVWHPAPGYSWSESWESFSDMEPPQMGEAWAWTGDGWEATRHSMSAEGVLQ